MTLRGALRFPVVAVVLALLFGAAPAAASPPAPDYYGLNVGTLLRLGIVPPERWAVYLDTMAAGGMTRARMDANWSAVEPRPPAAGVHTYVWHRPATPQSSMDTQAHLLAQRGIRMAPVLALPPAWAGSTSLRADRYADFAAFAAAFTRRYGPGGSFWAEHPELPALPVREYELWTEANSTNFWTGRADTPEEYVRALALITPAIKRVDPGAVMLASIGWEGGPAYVRAMYALGARGLFDGIGFHPYGPHVDAIADLVVEMRATLRELGESAMPIYVTETGQPVTYTGPGSPRADAGMVTDAARAATQSLTGDALARSDCGVRDFQVFSIVGTERPGQSDYEGFMGVMNISDGRPNATGAALLRAARRWRDAPASGIVLCGPGATPSSSLMALDLKIRHVSPTCVQGTTTYDGNPLEWADMELVAADGRLTTFKTASDGTTLLCVPDGPPVWSMEVVSRVPNIAVSQRYRCTIPATAAVPANSCVVLGPPGATGPARAAAGQPGPSAAAACRWSASVRLVRVGARSARVRLGAGCRLTAARARMTLSIVGPRGARRLRTVTLRPGLRAQWTLPRRLRAGERVRLSAPADRRRALPRLAVTTRTLGGDVRAGTEGCDYKLEARVVGAARARPQLRARLTCPPPLARGLRFTVSVRPLRGPVRRAASVTLRDGLLQDVVVRRRLVRGDRVLMTREADAASGIRMLRVGATVRVVKMAGRNGGGGRNR